MKLTTSTISLLSSSLLVGKAFAFGCKTHTFGVCQDNIVHWYDPDDGQICDPFDCGGGRAPPKKDVPGCAFYTGTETRRTEASYMPCFTSGRLVLTTEEPTVSPTPLPTTTQSDSPEETDAPDSDDTLTPSESQSTETGSNTPVVTTTFTTSTSATITDGPSITDAPDTGNEQESTSTSSTSTSTTLGGSAGSLVVASGSLMAAIIGAVVGAVAFL